MGSYSNITLRDAQGNIVGYTPVTASQPYVDTSRDSSAAGIAATVAKTGGAINPYLAQKAVAEGYTGPLYLPSASDTSVSGYAVPVAQVTAPTQVNWGRETVATPQYLSDSKVIAGVPSYEETTDVYVPYGSYVQTKISNAKIAIDPLTGELGIYQKPAGRSQYQLIGGGSRAAVQSGMFTVEKAQTPFVSTQEGVGTFKLPSGAGLSRLGAEAYGGLVQPLDSRTIESTGAKLSTYSNLGNLANYVSAEGVNLGKAAAPGAAIPWSLPEGAPAAQYMGPSGLTGEPIKLPTTGRLIGEKIVGGAAITTSGGKLPEPFISSPVRTTVEEPTGRIFGAYIPGASEALSFFQPSTVIQERVSYRTIPEVTTLKETRTSPVEGGMLTEKIYETTGGRVAATTVETTQKPSAFERWESDLSKSAYSGYGSLFGVSGEQARVALGTQSDIFKNIANVAPTSLNIQQTMGTAQIREGLEKPAEAAVNVGVGLLFGAGYKGLESAVVASRAASAERIISTGQSARAAEIFSGAVMDIAPKALGGLYAADVASRSTKGFTEFGAGSVASKGSTILTYEAAPMTLGGVVGYAAPGAIYKGARLSDIGYKAAVQEGATTGRFEYYIKQPVSKPYLQAKEFSTEVTAAGGSPIREAFALGKYELSAAYKTRVEQPTLSFMQEAPGRIERAQYAVQEPFVRTKVKGVPLAQTKVANLYIETAYGKYQPSKLLQRGGESVLEPFVRATVEGVPKAQAKAAEFAIDVMYTTKYQPSAVFGRSKIAAQSYWQETAAPALRGKVQDISTMLVRPGAEISEINRAAALSKEFKESGGAGAGIKITPFAQGAVGSRVTTTTVGGKRRSTLAKEPSLKSLGIAERLTEGKPTTIGSRADFRGVSKPMKPMGEYSGRKMGTSQIVLTEQLPVVEGMPTTSMMPQSAARTSITPSLMGFGMIRGAVQVLEPELEFSQQQRQRNRTELISVVTPRMEFAQRQDMLQELGQRQRQTQAIRQMQELRRPPAQVQRSRQEYSLARENAFVREPALRTRVGMDITATPRFDIFTRTTTTPKTTTTIVPEITKWRLTTPPPPTNGGFGFTWPGGATVSPLPRRRFGSLRETISLRSMLGGFFG